MAKSKGLHFYKKEKKLNKSVIRTIGTYIFLVAISFLLAGVIVYCVGIKTSVIGNSMEPTLSSGEEILINRVKYTFSKPKRYDVIVFLPNGNTKTHYYVKRVVGLPGEKIQIVDGKIYVNDTVLKDAVYFDKIAESGIASLSFTLGKDEYFVLGDNVNSSEDSRSANIGNVKFEDILGKAWFRFGTETTDMGLID